MNYELLRKKVLNNRFSLSYKNGEKLYLEKKVELIDIKDVNGIINIYARVYDIAKKRSTHIKVNNDGKVLSFKCNCELNEIARNNGTNFACEHIIATTLKLTESFEVKKEYRIKEDIEVSIRIEECFKKREKFNIILGLKSKGKLNICTIGELQQNVISDTGVYSIKKMNYSKEQRQLIRLVEKLDFKLRNEDIRNFLYLCRNIDFSMRLNSIEYKCNIIQEKIPIKFTLKVENERVKLQRTKSQINSLNNEKTVFLYEDKLYIPSFEYCKKFSLIHKVLEKSYFTYVKKDSLEKIVKVINSIGKLTINDEVKNILAEKRKLKFVLYNYENEYYGEFKFDKNEMYLEEAILSSEKVKIVEEILFSHAFTKKGKKYLFLGEDKDIFDLLKSELIDYCYVLKNDELDKLRLIDSRDIKASVKKVNNNFMFSIKNEEIDSVELYNALRDYQEGKEFYKLKNNDFFDFNDKKISEIMSFLNFIGYKGEDLYIPKEYEELINEENKKVDFIDILERSEINQSSKKILKPRFLKAKLRDYQLEGLRWMQEKKDTGLFGILADEMGLGKTIQAISFILKNKKEKTMVITQTSLVYNWQEEFEKFAPTLKVACVHGTKSKRKLILDNINKYDVILTSYGTLNMDLECYSKIKFNNLIIDEAQNIKNAKSKVAQSVKLINSDIRFALTGTPLENNLLEIWSLFDFLKPGYLFTQNEFKRKFNNSRDIEYLRLIIRPFILRRTKKEVLKDLPEKNDMTFFVPMTEEQERYYKKSIKAYGKEVIDSNNHISVLALLTKLRQIAIDPSLIDENYKGGSGKINIALDLVKKSLEANKKILIFSQFTSLLYRVKEKFNEENIDYFYLDGSTKADLRVKMCNEFNNSNEINIFLISLKAGGTGLNLTSAEQVIHFDPWWNPAVENQATDRAHRIGQKNKVDVIKIISKNTIEEKILKLKEAKNEMINELLSDEAREFSENRMLSKDDIAYLLEYENK